MRSVENSFSLKEIVGGITVPLSPYNSNQDEGQIKKGQPSNSKKGQAISYLQCDQMARLVGQYLSLTEMKTLPNRIKIGNIGSIICQMLNNKEITHTVLIVSGKIPLILVTLLIYQWNSLIDWGKEYQT